MADNDLQAPDALAPTSSAEGQPAPASDDKAQDAGAEGTQASKKVNLQEFPEFKEYQSKTDKQRAELERKATVAEQRAAEMQKRLESLEDAAYGKDDYGKMQLYAQRQAREAETLRAEVQAMRAEREAETAKMSALEKLAKKFDVPVSLMAHAKDYDEAEDLAIAERDRRIEAKLKGEDERRTANRPDVGGGATSTPTTRWEIEYADAQKRKDSVAMMRLLREQRKG